MNVEADRDEVYDVNRRTWSAKAKRGTEVSYTTYFLSNALLCVTGVHFIVYPLSTGLAMNRFLISGVHYYHVNGREWCMVDGLQRPRAPTPNLKGRCGEWQEAAREGRFCTDFERRPTRISKAKDAPCDSLTTR